MSRQVTRALSAETTGTQDTKHLCCQHPFIPSSTPSVREPAVGLEVPGRRPALTGPGKASVSFKRPIPGQKVKMGVGYQVGRGVPGQAELILRKRTHMVGGLTYTL